MSEPENEPALHTLIWQFRELDDDARQNMKTDERLPNRYALIRFYTMGTLVALERIYMDKVLHLLVEKNADRDNGSEVASHPPRDAINGTVHIS